MRTYRAVVKLCGMNHWSNCNNDSISKEVTNLKQVQSAREVKGHELSKSALSSVSGRLFVQTPHLSIVEEKHEEAEEKGKLMKGKKNEVGKFESKTYPFIS